MELNLYIDRTELGWYCSFEDGTYIRQDGTRRRSTGFTDDFNVGFFKKKKHLMKALKKHVVNNN